MGGMGVFSTDAQEMILKSCNAKQLQELKDIFQKQLNDKLFCFIFLSKNKKWLEAKFQCTHFINNFKDSYRQIPVFESKLGFIKRMSRRMDKYRAQLQKADEEMKA